MPAPSGFCEGTATIASGFFNPTVPAMGGIIQYFIDGNPITDPINITSIMNQDQIQAAINAEIIAADVTITITNFTSGMAGGSLTVAILIPSTTPVTSLPSASANFFAGFSRTPFLCNLTNPPSGTCEASLVVTTLTPPTSAGMDLTFFIGNPALPPGQNTPITNPIPIGNNMTLNDIQNAINANIIQSGTTITVISFDSNGLNVIIQVQSSSQISGSAIATYTNQVIPAASFVCNLRSRRRGARRIGVYLPPEIIYVPKSNFPKGAPATVTYRGFTYYYAGQNTTHYMYRRNGKNVSGRTGWVYGGG